MIQLSLFPQRGYGVVGVPGLVENSYDGLPFFTTKRYEALRVAEHLAWGAARVVRLERHEDSDDEGRPAFVVSEL